MLFSDPKSRPRLFLAQRPLNQLQLYDYPSDRDILSSETSSVLWLGPCTSSAPEALVEERARSAEVGFIDRIFVDCSDFLNSRVWVSIPGCLTEPFRLQQYSSLTGCKTTQIVTTIMCEALSCISGPRLRHMCPDGGCRLCGRNGCPWQILNADIWMEGPHRASSRFRFD